MKRISLNGIWSGRINYGLRGPRKPESVSNENDVRSIPFHVPGEIHQDLMLADMLDNVYVGMNVLKARWVEECNFYYTRTFSLSLSEKERVYLTFECLDYDAYIYINNKLCGEHHNFYTPYTLDITEAVQNGENRLTVALSSGLLSVAEKPVHKYQFAPELFDHLLHKRLWLRKPQFEFGWDWSERLINVGIQGDVYITISEDPFIEQIQLIPSLRENDQIGVLDLRLFCRGEGVLDFAVQVGENRFSASKIIRNGLCEYTVEIDRPKLWYPIGYGVPNTYEVSVNICRVGREIASKRFCTGFRDVHINQSAHPQKGNYFILEINGKPIFAKGANFVPADMIISNITPQTYKRLVQDAIDANFNMLRVWGGGLYESDEFYDLCNKKGVLVWQEFIFACINYPGDDSEFQRQVREEAEYQVRRLSRHPSLVVWCGNNEVNWLKAQMPELPSNDCDRRIYHELLPEIVHKNDPHKYYHESSPMSLNEGVFPNEETEGDQHPWDVGFEMVDYRKYREMNCRFPNEGGLNGAGSLKTAKNCFAGKEPEVHAPEFVLHDNYIDLLEVDGHSACNFIVWDNLGIDPLKIPFEQYCYLSGLAQGEGLKEYIDCFRSKKWDSASAIFWMFNDCWPTVRSWTIVDYYGRRTPAFERVRKAFAPIHAAFKQENGEFILTITNEYAKEICVEVEYGICSTLNGFLKSFKQDLCIQFGEIISLKTFKAEQIKDEREEFPYVIVRLNGKILASNRYFMERIKNLKFLPANIKVEHKQDCTELTSDVFAYGVCVDLDGEQKLSDNFFELYPGIPVQTDKGTQVLYCYNNIQK